MHSRPGGPARRQELSGREEESGRFALDSALEGNGFEISVPRQIGSDFEGFGRIGGRSTVGRRYHPSGRRPRKPIERRRSLRSATYRRDEGAHAVGDGEISRN